MNLPKEKRAMLLAAKQAAKVLMHYYGKKEKIKEKPNKSLVATADLEVNKAIIKTIKKYFPKHSILSEETGFEDNKSDYKWVIDPIDGTHNFLHQIPFFGTSIALEYRNEVVLGVLHFPLLSITAIAERNKGAFLNGKRIFVSDKKDLDHSFILVEFAYANRKEKTDFLRKLTNKAIDVRNFGAAVYHLLLVACGKCDGYIILSTHEWDVAAGFLMVEEAGGKITDLHGNKWDSHQSKYIVSNTKVHKDILRLIK
ncbi:MAG: inositol monophosphatase family protein [Nanoarchaeota archaeon]|nr:inositol monophosphatase family protein [Nanoarchaeota archaeon]